MLAAKSNWHSSSEWSSAKAVVTARAPVVICGVQDPVAEAAVLTFVAELVERIEGRLVLMHAQPPPLLPLEPQIAYAAGQSDPGRGLRAIARTLAQQAADAGVGPTTKVHVAFGDLEERLLATARRESDAVIVIGSAVAPGSRRSGSLARRLIERASCPVVVVPPRRADGGCDAASDWGHEPIAAVRAARDAVPVTSNEGDDVTKSSIVCGVDGSRDARVALRLAGQLSKQLGVRLVVTHVVQPPVLAPGLGPTARQLATIPVDALLAGGEALVERILKEEQFDDAERRVVLGFPADRLADIADDEAADLLVVGSRGRGAFKAAFLGSVSTDLIGVARCPVLIVPPSAAVALSEREDTDTAIARAI